VGRKKGNTCLVEVEAMREKDKGKIDVGDDGDDDFDVDDDDDIDKEGGEELYRKKYKNTTSST